jgi:hypothetical protein
MAMFPLIRKDRLIRIRGSRGASLAPPVTNQGAASYDKNKPSCRIDESYSPCFAIFRLIIRPVYSARYRRDARAASQGYLLRVRRTVARHRSEADGSYAPLIRCSMASVTTEKLLAEWPGNTGL